jgi:hypothetical protein
MYTAFDLCDHLRWACAPITGCLGRSTGVPLTSSVLSGSNSERSSGFDVPKVSMGEELESLPTCGPRRLLFLPGLFQLSRNPLEPDCNWIPSATGAQLLCCENDRSCRSALGAVQFELLHDPVDHAVDRGGIRVQAFF